MNTITKIICIIWTTLIFIPIADADSIDVNLISKHIDTKYNFNEENFGLGYTKDFHPHWQGKVGFYKNSYNKDSIYAMINLKHDAKRFAYGIQFGFVSGYDKIKPKERTYTHTHKYRKHYKYKSYKEKHTETNKVVNLNALQFMVLPNLTWKITKEHRLQLGVLPSLTKSSISLYTLQYQYSY